MFGATNLDIPSLPASMYGIFEKKDVVIIDVGGDDAGSMVLGRFKPQFDKVDYDMLYVINRFRSMSKDLDEAVDVLGEIEAVSGLKPRYLVNNSHMMAETNQAIYEEGKQFAGMISEKTGLPVLCHTIDREFYDTGIVVPDVNDNIYPLEIYVKTVWQKNKIIRI